MGMHPCHRGGGDRPCASGLGDCESRHPRRHRFHRHIPPGFGFGKTRPGNFRILDEMDKLQVLGLPVLAAMSRKRMVYETLESTPAESLNGTTVVNTMALMRGASIIRVHDVRPAVEAVKIYNALCSSNLA